MSSSSHSRDVDSLGLARKAADGDAEAVDALLERYLPELRAFVRLRAGAVVRARESRSDLVQSVCREVLEKVEHFRYPSEGAFRQWLFRTALRKIVNRREFHLAQKRDALRDVSLDARTSSEGDARLLEIYGSFTSPSHRAAVADELARVEAAFDQLTEDERAVVTMAHLEGLSRAEIAEQTGRSEGAVRVLLHRTLAKLADILAE